MKDHHQSSFSSFHHGAGSVRLLALRTVLAPLLAYMTLTIALSARAEAPDSVRREAAERFDRALGLVNDGDLSGGLAEFQRAYSLVPAPSVLYNLGLVYAALHRPVEARGALEQVVARPDALKPGELGRARAVLQEQDAFIGYVAVTIALPQGTIEIDNLEVAKLPLTAPLAVATGAHVVGVISPGYAPARREVLVAGKQTSSVQLEPIAIEGRLAHIAVACRVPGADVLVDGVRVGKTPLVSTITVPPGTHHVEMRRAGYRPTVTDITLQDGALGTLTLTPEIDSAALASDGGSLEVHASESQSVVSVDGGESVLLVNPLRLPVGTHRLRLERGGFLPAERDVDVPLGAAVTVAVALKPTPDTRVQYVSSAERRRNWSWAAIGTGVAVGAAGTVLALLEQARMPAAQSALNAANASAVPGSNGSCDPSRNLGNDISACQSLLQDTASRVNQIETLRAIGWVSAGVGGALAATGVALLITGDDPHKYDENRATRAIARMHLTPLVQPGLVAVSASMAF